MVIRKFQDSDLNQIIELFENAFELEKINEDKCKEKLNYLLKSNKYIIYVIDDNSMILGACVIYLHTDPFDRDFATLWYFAIKEDCKGKGLGTSLLNFVKKDLEKYNLDSLILTTSNQNIACQKASEKASFQKRLSYKILYSK